MRIVFIDITHERGIKPSNINVCLHSIAWKAICSTLEPHYCILDVDSDYLYIEYDYHLYARYGARIGPSSASHCQKTDN